MSWTKGQKYEQLAEKYLKSKGYLILDRNWHAGVYGEIDLICRKDRTLVFVEVKGRSSRFAKEDCLTAIDKSKAKKLLYSMQSYLDYLETTKKIYSPKVRFDLLVVVEDKLKQEFEVEQFENISLFDLLES
ncbi:MAG: YraN family protein [Candidatus Caenarcaniphilales bacterium]|nr:YraN family protein [Candidatus Caenarcaniphilales bacterium]